MYKIKSDYIFYYIYKITNLITKKIYIGKRCSRVLPELDNYWGSGVYLRNSMRKYGKVNFKKEIVEQFQIQDTLNEREIFWISFFDSMNINIGYNLTKGGDGGGLCGVLNPMFGMCKELNGFYGKKHPESLVVKMRELALNRVVEECPWCHKIMNFVNARQYHFDNCMYHPNISEAKVLERKNKMSAAMLSSKTKIKCPYCGKMASHTNSKKYHFENCLHASNISEYTINRLKDKEETLIIRKEMQRIERESREVKHYKCEHCGYDTENQGNFLKWHGDNCVHNPNCKRKIFTCSKCGLTTTNKTNITRFHNDKCGDKVACKQNQKPRTT
jgi:predicted RNA-binding Zn-ribbon protein involved in translation (DUF1610 family)